MALKTERANAPKIDALTPPNALAANTTVLELALYKIYTWGDVTYEQGKPYRFKNSDAMQLLAERDLDRPIWKMYKPPVVKSTPAPEVTDVSAIPETLDEFGQPVVHSLSVGNEKKRIDIGDDSEIQDVLGKDEDVTV